MADRRITYFAETNAPSRKVRFGIRSVDRDKHVYIIGKTGMGKSTLMENMIVQDIKSGEGVIFIDPHGISAERILDHVPEDRIQDVLYFAPHDAQHPIAFNVLDNVDYDKRHVVVQGLIQLFEKMWESKLDSKTRYILHNVLLALLEYPDATPLDINKVISDTSYRAMIASHVTDPHIKEFLEKEFPAYTDAFLSAVSIAVDDNIRRIAGDPIIRNIIDHPDSSFDMRKLMDEKKIIIANLAKGKIGNDNAQFLGSTLITRVYDAALGRAPLHEFDLEHIPPTYLYVDEFQSFSNRSFVEMFSEARKYKLSLTIAHQYTGQMSPEVRNAILGNVGTIISFSVGSEDAKLLADQFQPVFSPSDVVGLGLGEIYLKLMIDGSTSDPFSAATFKPLEAPRISHRDRVIAASRRQFSVPPKVSLE